MKHIFSNVEIVTIAVYLLGGDSRYVDTEDVAMKANELAPNRFTWRKYPDQINLEHVRVRLSQAKSPASGPYLLGSGSKGWLLTQEGLAFSQQHVQAFNEVDLSRKPMSQRDRQWLQQERARMLATDALHTYHAAGEQGVSVREAEEFFRVDDYVVGMARERKVVRIVNMLADDPELGEVTRVLAKKVQGK